MRNLIAPANVTEENREQARRLKVRLVRWMQEHEPHKAADLEQRKI